MIAAQGLAVNKDIAVIAPDTLVVELFENLRSRTTVEFSLGLGLLGEGVPVAQEFVRHGAKVLISRGETTKLIRRALPSVSVVDIPVSVHDVIPLINQARAYSNRIAVVGFGEGARAAQALVPILSSLELGIFTLTSVEQMPEALCKVKEMGFEVMVGPPIAVGMGHELGLRGFPLVSAEPVVLAVLDEAGKLAELVRRENDLVRRQVTVHSGQAGVLFIDAQGRVIRSDLPPPLEEAVSRALFKEEQGGRILKHERILRSVRGGESANGRIGGVNGVLYGYKIQAVIGDEKNMGSVIIIEPYKAQTVSTPQGGSGFFAEHRFSDCVAKSLCIRKMLADAEKFSKVDLPVLILGESGTGKELVAQSIHNASKRREGPFVAVNCAALPEPLLESELFGYQEGAFTGAKKGGKLGLFELADGGTVFLDEIGEMPLPLQAKLLRVLDERRIIRLGGERTLNIDMRLLCATNRNLEEYTASGRFRHDLFHRINVLRVCLPPLRQRGQCLEVLIERFLSDICVRLDLPRPELSPEVLNVLLAYDYPGNIRELRSILERLTVIHGGKKPTPEDMSELLGRPALGKEFQPGTDLPNEQRTEGLLFEEEKRLIHQVLAECRGNRAETARRLGISTATLWRRLNRS